MVSCSSFGTNCEHEIRCLECCDVHLYVTPTLRYYMFYFPFQFSPVNLRTNVRYKNGLKLQTLYNISSLGIH